MFKKIKIYNEITNFNKIARRLFTINFFDGLLTILGILLGFFVIILNDPTIPSIESFFILLPGLGTSISMFVSGSSGSYLSERAEQRKEKIELDKAMLLYENEETVEKVDDNEILEIQKAMITPVNLGKKRAKIRQRITRRNPNKKKSLYERAESFASIVISFINGGSPFIGGLIPLIPFFLMPVATLTTFLLSFTIIIICIVLLGIFLGLISKESIFKSILQMFIAFVSTFLIIVVLLSLNPY